MRLALLKAASSHDSTEAPELCADIRAGEIVVFDKACVDASHPHAFTQREVLWVTRAKDNMAYEIVGQHPSRRPYEPGRVEPTCRGPLHDPRERRRAAT